MIQTSGTPSQIVAADLDSDRRVDIVYQDAPNGGNLHVLLSRGNGTFVTGQVVALPAGVGSVMTAGDINGDGIPDLVLSFDAYPSQATLAPSFAVLLGRGDGTFLGPVYSVGSATQIARVPEGRSIFDSVKEIRVLASHRAMQAT